MCKYKKSLTATFPHQIVFKNLFLSVDHNDITLSKSQCAQLFSGINHNLLRKIM